MFFTLDFFASFNHKAKPAGVNKKSSQTSYKSAKFSNLETGFKTKESASNHANHAKSLKT